MTTDSKDRPAGSIVGTGRIEAANTLSGEESANQPWPPRCIKCDSTNVFEETIWGPADTNYSYVQTICKDCGAME